MKTRTLWTALAVVAVLTGLGGAAGQARSRNQGSAMASPAAPLTATETANILRLREEEKLARDVYQVFAQMWPCPTFTNIAGAEQRHMDAVGRLIMMYGLTDPVTDNTIGIFGTPEFSGLYTTLTQNGAKSLGDALKAGVQIEQLGIADLAAALSQTDKSDIQQVSANLLQGSTNHLRAFTRGVETGGTRCTLQGASRGTGNNAASGTGVCQGCGRGGRGNGNCYRNGNQSGGGQGNGLQKRDGTCLMLNPIQP